MCGGTTRANRSRRPAPALPAASPYASRWECEVCATERRSAAARRRTTHPACAWAADRGRSAHGAVWRRSWHTPGCPTTARDRGCRSTSARPPRGKPGIRPTHPAWCHKRDNGRRLHSRAPRDCPPLGPSCSTASRIVAHTVGSIVRSDQLAVITEGPGPCDLAHPLPPRANGLTRPARGSPSSARPNRPPG
jgi:hypothetical protein